MVTNPYVHLDSMRSAAACLVEENVKIVLVNFLIHN